MLINHDSFSQFVDNSSYLVADNPSDLVAGMYQTPDVGVYSSSSGEET
jgi:hypothetical protein